MQYPYRCPEPNCAKEFDVIKSVADIDLVENCPQCGTQAERFIATTHFYGASDWDKAEYNPAFGKVVRNGKERKELARRHGMEEIGNEPVDKIHDHFDKQRERKRQERWESV